MIEKAKEKKSASERRLKLQSELDPLLISGQQAYRAGRLVDAVKKWRQVLEIDPENPSALEVLERTKDERLELSRKLYQDGVNQYILRKYRDAITSWNQVLVLDPGHPTVQRDIQRARQESRALKNAGN